MFHYPGLPLSGSLTSNQFTVVERDQLSIWLNWLCAESKGGMDTSNTNIQMEVNLSLITI
jgi:hypothetical protein